MIDPHTLVLMNFRVIKFSYTIVGGRNNRHEVSRYLDGRILIIIYEISDYTSMFEIKI